MVADLGYNRAELNTLRNKLRSWNGKIRHTDRLLWKFSDYSENQNWGKDYTNARDSEFTIKGWIGYVFNKDDNE